MSDSNSAKGRNSFDITTGNILIPFFNRNSQEYPTEVGSVRFEPVPIREHKDIMLNVARMSAEQEYNRIMALVRVLEDQARDIRRRLDITDMVHRAKYNFKPVHGTVYWLVEDQRQQQIILSMLGPNDWSSGSPDYYKYITQVQWLGDYTWKEVEDQNGNV